MKKWAIYAVAAAVLVGLTAVAAGLWLPPQVRAAVWTGLGTAWLVQAAAFGILIASTRRRPKLIIAGWTAGTVLRLGALGALAWLTLSGAWGLPAEPTLVALVLALFGLLLLEPVVFGYRFGDR